MRKLKYSRKTGICLVCGKATSTQTYTRCQACRIKILRGKLSPNYKQEPKRCSVCNKIIDDRATLCLQHYRERNQTKQKVYTHCIDCGKFKGKSYGHPRCRACSHTGILSPRRGKTAHGKHLKFKGIWLKSGYEYLYAQWLENSNIKWQYEPKAFDLGKITYTPDFYLPESNKWIEVKGWWRGDAKRKFRLFKKQYPGILIDVIGRPELTKLGLITPGGKYRLTN